MIFYSEKNVYEAAKERIKWIFQEFEGRRIVVSFSGGKDSTVILNLTKEVMDELGVEKIPVFFCDQEVEAPQTIDYVREVMNLPWVEPYWIQSYFQEWNSSAGKWFNVWGKGEKWCREKEPNNPYTDIEYDKTQMFKEVLHSMLKYHFGEDYVCLGGVRIEESPMRRLGLTKAECYKGVTWGKASGKHSLVLYPIWDWSCNDVWYYIFSNKLNYCKLYNYLFTKKGLTKCRVSSFIHENAIQALSEIKEIAPKFYAAALKRVANVNTTVQTLDMLKQYITSVPPYFEDWDDYVNYLADHLIAEKKNRDKIKKGYKYYTSHWREKFGKYEEGIKKINESIGYSTAVAILSEDFEMTKVENACYSLAVYYKGVKDEIKRANQ